MPVSWKASRKRIMTAFSRQRGPRKNKNYSKEEPVLFDPNLMGRLKSHADTARERIARQHALSARVVLLPDGGYRALWDCICIVALGYTFLEIPYALVFLDTSCLWEARDIVNLLCDCIFLFDVLLNFNTAFYDENLVLVDDHKRIFIRYISTWFILDLVSSLPMERIVCAGGSDSSGNQAYLRFFKILRLVKMLRLLRFLRVIKKWEMLSGSGFVSRAIRLFKLANFLIFCAHVCGCFWMLIISDECMIPGDERPDFSTTCGCQGPDCYRWNWLERYDPDLAANGTPESKYLASLYFSIVTLSTVGYGDITPTNDAERMYSIFLALTGAVVFAFCIGSISSLATEGNRTETVIDERIKEITDFLRFQRLPRTIEAKVRKDLLHASAKAPHLFHPCLHMLPRYIRTEVFDYIMSDETGRIPMFNHMDSDCRAHITALLRPISLNSQEYLYRALDSADEMYFVTNGVLEEWDLHGERITAKCSVGDIVGEMNMFVDPEIPVRLSSVRSRTKAELLVLKREDFLNEIKPHFPDVYLAIRDLALEQLQYVDLDAVAVKMCERSQARCSGFTHQRAHFIKMMEEVQKVHRLDPSLVQATTAYRHAGALASVRSGSISHPPDYLLSTRSYQSVSPAIRPTPAPGRLNPLGDRDGQSAYSGGEARGKGGGGGERWFGERGLLVGDEAGAAGSGQAGEHQECTAAVQAAVGSLREEVGGRLATLEQSMQLLLQAMAAVHASHNSFDVLALYGKPDPALRASEALAAAAAAAGQQRVQSSPFSSPGPGTPRGERFEAKDDVHLRPSRHLAARIEGAALLAKPRSNSHGDLFAEGPRRPSLPLPSVHELRAEGRGAAGGNLKPPRGNGGARIAEERGAYKPRKSSHVRELAPVASRPESELSLYVSPLPPASEPPLAERRSAGVTEEAVEGGSMSDVADLISHPSLSPGHVSPASGAPTAAHGSDDSGLGPQKRSPAHEHQPDGSAGEEPARRAQPDLPGSVGAGVPGDESAELRAPSPETQPAAPPPPPQQQQDGGSGGQGPMAVAQRAMLPPSPAELPALRKRNPFF